MAIRRYPQAPIDIQSPTRLNSARYLINHHFSITDGGTATPEQPFSTPGILVNLTHRLCLENTACSTVCCTERNTLPALSSELLALYYFDFGVGQFIKDESSNNLHALFGSTSSSEVSDPSWNSHGVLFGSGSIVTIPNTGGILGMTDSGFSVVASLRSEAGSFPNTILTDTSGANFRIIRNGSGSGTDLVIEVAGSPIISATSFFTASAFTGNIGLSIVSGVSIQVYKNGLLFASGGHSAAFTDFLSDLTISSGTGGLNIGSEFYALAFYNRSLTATEQNYMSSSFDEILSSRNLVKEG